MNSPQTALITGASEGLGLSLALELARRGFILTLVARRQGRLEEAMEQLEGSGHTCFAADLAAPEQAQILSEMIASRPFDVLVNNAGASRFGRFDELSYANLQRILQLNFATPALLGWAFLRSAPAGSRLVNVTSIMGVVGSPGNALYGAAKAGLQSLSESLWYEGAARGIHVLDFRPVSLKTAFHQTAGKPSMAGSAMTATPEQAASDLADAIEARRDFVYPYGRLASLLTTVSRWLPRRWVIRLMARNAERVGYLSQPAQLTR